MKLLVLACSLLSIVLCVPLTLNVVQDRFKTALLQNDLVAIRATMDLGADVNQIMDDGRYPIHLLVDTAPIVCLNNHFCYQDLLQEMINLGADVNARGQYGESALHLAVHNIDLISTGMLLSDGADINAMDNGGFTPFYVALKTRNKDYWSY